MNSELQHPFIKSFVISIISSIKDNKMSFEDREVINADLIPRTSRQVFEAGLYTIDKAKLNNFIPIPIRERQQVSILDNKHAPVIRREVPMKIEPSKTEIMKKTPFRIRPVQQVTLSPRPVVQVNPSMPVPIQGPRNFSPEPPPQLNMNSEFSQDYGRIMPLLNDPSVSSIECSGPGKMITIIRAGQKQFTKIVLNPNDIKEILERVSDSARVPVLEGVFRAAVDNFVINAIVSDVIGSRFIIKKATPYSMLER